MSKSNKRIKLYAKRPKRQKLDFLGSVEESDFKLIRNRIIGHGEGGIKELVTNLLIKGGWDPIRDERNIFAPVIEIFMQTPDVNLAKLREFVERKETTTFLNAHLEYDSPFHLHEMFKFGLKGIYPPEAVSTLVDNLWQVTTCVNQIGVGPGEICFTVLSNAKKGIRGDLMVPNIGSVEVKSTFGRLGSGDNALLVPERFKAILEARHFTIDDVRALRSRVEGKAEKKSKKQLWSWNEAVQSFFYYDWGLGKETLELAFSYLSTQKLSVSHQGQLVRGIRKLLTDYPIIENVRKFDRDELCRIVLAIQLCTYQIQEQFAYLIAANKATKKACVLPFKSDRLDENLVSIYKKLLQINRFTSNLSIDSEGTRKGVELNFI